MRLPAESASGGQFLADASVFDHAHHVGFLHDQKVLTVDFDFGAGPLSEQDAVAGFEFERLNFAALVSGAGSDGDDLAFLRLPP